MFIECGRWVQRMEYACDRSKISSSDSESLLSLSLSFVCDFLRISSEESVSVLENSSMWFLPADARMTCRAASNCASPLEELEREERNKSIF